MAEIERQESEANAAAQAIDAQNEGVTESGLQWTRVRASADRKLPKPSARDVVRVHYEGRLTDGTVFDSSYARGEPAEFPLNRVIPGWTEGLQLMRPGDEFSLVIPPELAYGPAGAPPAIPPNATLEFKVELLSFTRARDGALVEAPAAP